MKHSGGRPQSIHHITAIAGDPQRNLDFYSGVLGLRLVKLTVNFDDPGTYHLYYGDEHGHPGSLITFFPWPDGQPGRQGTGQVGTIALAIVPSSLGFWLERLLSQGIKYQGPDRRFDEQVLHSRTRTVSFSSWWQRPESRTPCPGPTVRCRPTRQFEEFMAP